MRLRQLASALALAALGASWLPAQEPADPTAADEWRKARTLLDLLGREGGALLELERELRALYLRLSPSLVEVRSRVAGAEGEREIATAGVVLTRDGLVVAPVFAAPAAGETPALEVRRADGARFEGRVLQRDEAYGLALIRVDGLRGMEPRLFPGEWLQEGAPVIALGNAFGLDASMSIGILTGRARYAGAARRLLQVSNPINPGDGGGLLANSRGEVVGILLSSLAELAEAGVAVGVERMEPEAETPLGPDRGRALRSDGIGFAVPIEIVVSLFPEQLGGLLQRQRMLGVEVVSRLWVAESAAGPQRRWVVEVVAVLSGSAAEAAGLAAGDLLLELDGRPVETLEDLGYAMFRAGERTRVVVLRGGAPQALELDFGAWTAPLPDFRPRPPRADGDDE